VKEYKASDIKTISLMESIRKRPGMYVGSLDAKGIYVMIENFLLHLIMSYNLKEVIIELCTDNKVNITSSKLDILPFIQNMNTIKGEYDVRDLSILKKIMDIGVLIGLSESIKIQACSVAQIYTIEGSRGEFDLNTNGASISDNLLIELLPDRQVFTNTDINFDFLNSIFRRIAYLNPEIKIISIDTGHNEYQRCVFHYPQGIFQKMDNLIAERTFNHPSFRLDIDTVKNDYHYRISLCSLGYTISPYMQSFASYVDTIYHGSLMDGVVKGIIQAVDDFSIKNNIKIDLSSEDILEEEGFIIMASVMGDNFSFGGSLKIKLDMPQLETDVQEIVYEELSEYFEANAEKARNFVNRFRIRD